MLALERLDAARPSHDRRLFPGKVLRLACRGAGSLAARDGSLWITFEKVADPARRTAEDHFLADGQSLPVQAGDVVVVSAGDPRYGLAAFDWIPQVRPWRRPVPARRPVFLQALARLAGAEGALLA